MKFTLASLREHDGRRAGGSGQVIGIDPGKGLASVSSSSPGRSVEDVNVGFRLDRLGRFGVAMLLVQGAAMLWWSTSLWQHFALTYDYSAYHQAWWLIAHGHLNPFSSVFGYSFWRNDLELGIWPLALIGVVFSHGPVMQYAQVGCLITAEIVAWTWMQKSLAHRLSGRGKPLAIAGLLLLLANPWAWSAISFDFHTEMLALPFAVLAAYDLAHGRRRAWLWVAFTLVCGEVPATWVAGLGIGAIVAGSQWRRQGVALLVLGLAWIALVSALHANQGGDAVALYRYLAGSHVGRHATLLGILPAIALHPASILGALWHHRLDIWANVSPGGVVGLASPWALGLALPVLLADNLVLGNTFAQPLFQNVLLYVMVPLGTILVLVPIYIRWQKVAVGVAAVAAVNALAWSAIWGPEIPTTWLRVPAGSAAVLSRADAMIPKSAEVVASQGVAGRFSDRSLLHLLITPGQVIPLRGTESWWVIAPRIGIELVPSIDQSDLVAELAGPLHAHLALRGHGIWVFRLKLPTTARSLTLPRAPAELPGWLFPGPAGTPLIGGPPSSWTLASSGRTGYVLSGDYWREPAGMFIATVRLATQVPLNVEVWNVTGNVLLARRSILPGRGFQTITIQVESDRIYRPDISSGWGPYQKLSVPRPSGNRLEIRVWSPGHGYAEVAGVGLTRAQSR